MVRKAEASFEVKKIVWDTAATVGRDKWTAIQRQVDYELEKLRKEGEIFEDTPDIRTVQRIVNTDINQLSPDVVLSKLPQHVWCLRNDYEKLKELAKQSGQVLQGMDPIVAKAQEEHLSEIRSLIEKWKERLHTMTIRNACLSDPNSVVIPLELLLEQYQSHTYNVEINPLFGSLKEHLPFPMLWQDYSAWLKNEFDYFHNCESLTKQIADRITRCQEVLMLGKDFVGPIIDCVNTTVLGYDNPGLFNFRSESRTNIEDELGDIIPHCEVLFVNGHWQVLYAQDALACSESYRAICDYFMDSEIVTNVITLFKECKALEARAQEALQEILLRRDYINYNCRLCPAQLKPSR